MRTIVSRLIRHKSSLSQTRFVSASSGGRYFSTDSNKVDEPFNVEEAETVHAPPPPTEKLLVLGGNGFVGSHVCKEALDRGLSVSSISRSGRSSLQESWATRVTWHQGNLLSSDSLKDALDGVTSVLSGMNHCRSLVLVVLVQTRICIRLTGLQTSTQLELLLKMVLKDLSIFLLRIMDKPTTC